MLRCLDSPNLLQDSMFYFNNYKWNTIGKSKKFVIKVESLIMDLFGDSNRGLKDMQK